MKTTPDTKKAERAEEITNGKESITEKEINLATDTLVGDLRDAMLGRLRASKKPWEQMSEAEQRDVVEQFTNAAKNLVKKAVTLLAANGRDTIVGHMHEIKIAKGLLTAKVTTRATDETTLMLKAAQDKTILIVAADSGEYEGEKAPVEIDPDQSDLESRLAKKTSGAKVSRIS
jgi:hypothetical protein